MFAATRRWAEEVENTKHLKDDLGQLNVVALVPHLERARASYDENMSTYVRLLLRRSFGRVMVGPSH